MRSPIRLLIANPEFIPFNIFHLILVDLDVLDTLIVACKELEPSSCYVLNGTLQLYIDEDQIVNKDDVDKEKESIENLIQTNMNSGAYDNAHEEIEQLYFVEKLDPTESNQSDEKDGDGSAAKRNNRSLRMGLFVGIGALTAVLSGVIFRVTRRMRNNDDQTEIQTGVGQTYLDVEGQRPSFS